MAEEIKYDVVAENKTAGVFNKIGKDANKAGNDMSKAFTGAFASLDNAMGTSLSKFASFGSMFAKAFNPVTIAVGLATAAVLGLVYSINQLDKTKEAADKLSLLTSEYMKWDAILKQNGTNMQEAGTAFSKLAEFAYNYSKDTSKQTEELKKLGLTVKDNNGNFKDNSVLMTDIITTLSKVDDKTKRAALAQSVFGKSYKDFMPVIENFAETNKELGDTFDKNADKINAAATAADNIKDKFGALFVKLQMKIFDAFSDEIIKLAKFMDGPVFEDMVKNMKWWVEQSINVLDFLIKGIKSSFLITTSIITTLDISFKKLDLMATKIMNNPFAISVGKAGVNALTQIIKLTEKSIQGYETFDIKNYKERLNKGILSQKEYDTIINKMMDEREKRAVEYSDIIKKNDLLQSLSTKEIIEKTNEIIANKESEINISLDALLKQQEDFIQIWDKNNKEIIVPSKPKNNNTSDNLTSPDDKKDTTEKKKTNISGYNTYDIAERIRAVEAMGDAEIKTLNDTIKEKLILLESEKNKRQNSFKQMYENGYISQEEYNNTILNLEKNLWINKNAIAENGTAEYNAKIEADQQKTLDSIQKHFDSVTNMYNEVYSNIDRVVDEATNLADLKNKNSLDIRTKQTEDWYNNQKEILNNSTMSRRAYDKAIQKLDQEKKKKDDQIRNEAEKQQKKDMKRAMMLQLLQIAADGGAGSAQIWAGEGPWQLKLARQIALGVSITGAQILVAAQMAQLADGGIIAGTKKTGDQNVVRVNANEMILNEQQQSTLWKVANGAKIPDNMNNINSYKTSTPNNIDMSGDIIIQGNVTDNQLDKISNIKAQQMIDLNKLVQQLEELNFRGILRPIINNSGVF